MEIPMDTAIGALAVGSLWTVGRVAMTFLALRGSAPAERPAILLSLAEVFRAGAPAGAFVRPRPGRPTELPRSAAAPGVAARPGQLIGSAAARDPEGSKHTGNF
jgi:hypothetical protein